ncbi:MAG: hypothetical protein IJU23_07255, partial [Proteobacteria bacterium]|nr:hypothetical protein [Pseudomonadota bacterium]
NIFFRSPKKAKIDDKKFVNLINPTYKDARKLSNGADFNALRHFSHGVKNENQKLYDSGNHGRMPRISWLF